MDMTHTSTNTKQGVVIASGLESSVSYIPRRSGKCPSSVFGPLEDRIIDCLKGSSVASLNCIYKTSQFWRDKNNGDSSASFAGSGRFEHVISRVFSCASLSHHPTGLAVNLSAVNMTGLGLIPPHPSSPHTHCCQ